MVNVEVVGGRNEEGRRSGGVKNLLTSQREAISASGTPAAPVLSTFWLKANLRRACRNVRRDGRRRVDDS